jgi:hypothetical protein
MTILPYTLEQKEQVSSSLLGNLRSIERNYRRHDRD